MKKLLSVGVIVLFIGLAIPSTGTTDVKQITIPDTLQSLVNNHPPYPPLMWTEDFSTFYPYDSTTVKLNHTWHQKGNFTIRAQAKDVCDLESDWGELEVTMPINKAVDSPFFDFIETHFLKLFWLFSYINYLIAQK